MSQQYRGKVVGGGPKFLLQIYTLRILLSPDFPTHEQTQANKTELVDESSLQMRCKCKVSVRKTALRARSTLTFLKQPDSCWQYAKVDTQLSTHGESLSLSSRRVQMKGVPQVKGTEPHRRSQIKLPYYGTLRKDENTISMANLY